MVAVIVRNNQHILIVVEPQHWVGRHLIARLVAVPINHNKCRILLNRKKDVSLDSNLHRTRIRRHRTEQAQHKQCRQTKLAKT